MELHYSQTLHPSGCSAHRFYYLMELHYSQTKKPSAATAESFTTLWNYTILKQWVCTPVPLAGFTTLWNYTILKHINSDTCCGKGFTTLWNYTILKPQIKCAHYHAHGNSIGYLHHTMFSFHCQQFRTNRCRYKLLSLFQHLKKTCFQY